MTTPFREGLLMAVDDARAEGDREERESGVEVRRVLDRVRGRRRKVRVSAVTRSPPTSCAAFGPASPKTGKP